MQNRIAPQEILQPNEEVEVEQSEMSDEDRGDKDEKESTMPEAGFSQVKLASKYAAFLKLSKDGQHYLHYST